MATDPDECVYGSPARRDPCPPRAPHPLRHVSSFPPLLPLPISCLFSVPACSAFQPPQPFQPLPRYSSCVPIAFHNPVSLVAVRAAYYSGMWCVTDHFAPVCVPWRERAPKCSWRRVFKSAFLPLKPCKNARPEITPNRSGIWLRFNISLSAIDRCPPFRAKRKDKAPYTELLKTGHRISRAKPPSRAPGPG